MTLVFSEDVHALLNYKVSSCLCVGVHTPSTHAYIQALLRGMCNDELVCLNLPLMIY